MYSSKMRRGGPGGKVSPMHAKRRRKATVIGLLGLLVLLALISVVRNLSAPEPEPGSQAGGPVQPSPPGLRERSAASEEERAAQSEIEALVARAWPTGSVTAPKHPGKQAVAVMTERLRMLRAEHGKDSVYQAKVDSMLRQLRECETDAPDKAISCSRACGVGDHDWLLIRRLGGKKIFVGFNLHNNEELMPHFLTELMAFVLLLPRGNVYISAFESGSKDFTPLWLELLDKILVGYRVPHRVLYGDYDMRLKSRRQHRIEFLAHVRNIVMEPLPLFNSTAGGAQPWHRSADGAVIEDGWIEPFGSRERFDKVLFVNDVYFCAQDLARLLEHDADMTCGLDFLPPHKGHRRLCERHNSRLYDIWVSRDLEGRRMDNCPPYVVSDGLEHHVQALARGLPIPVQCCWNGMVALNAEPFHRGLRFRYARVTYNMQKYYLHKGSRTQVPGEQGDECAASECSLICKDLWNGGYGRIVMDPRVKVSYQEQYDWFQNGREAAWPEIDEGVRLAAMRDREVMAGLGYSTDEKRWMPGQNGPSGVECCPMKTVSGFVGDILGQDSGTCYNESTSSALYKLHTPLLLPLIG